MMEGVTITGTIYKDVIIKQNKQKAGLLVTVPLLIIISAASFSASLSSSFSDFVRFSLTLI